MVEPPTSVAGPEIAEGLAALFDHASPGVSDLGTLQHLADLAPEATGAVGAVFVEGGCGGGERGAGDCGAGGPGASAGGGSQGAGRVVAAGGALDWLRGRPVLTRGIATPGFAIRPWSDGRRLREVDWSELDPETQRRLTASGIRRIVQVALVVDARHVGCFLLYYPVGAPALTESQRVTIGLLAACAAGLYAVGSGSPFEREPAVRAVSDDRNLFIAVTSHELRTPVTVIRGFADTLNEHWDQLDEPARRSAISVIGQRAKDLGRLLDRLLSAAGDGIGPVRPAAGGPFNLVEAVRQAAEELPADFRRDLRLDLPAELPKAFGDRSAVATILTELVTNACKYSHQRPDVEVTAGTDHSAVWLRVSDRGVGIRPEHVERAFERFWQLETGNQQRYGGVGLGLYLVRGVVERHKGWVSLRPRDGGGTIAEVRLRRAVTTPGEA